MPAGRPTTYTKEIAQEICDIIANSNRGLSSICKEDRFPSRITIYDWLSKHEEFANMYARAKEDQADFMAEEILELADNKNKTEIEFINAEGSSTTIKDNVERSKLQIESRKWLAMKLKPRKYGDKIDLTSGGEKIEPTTIIWGGNKIDV